MGALKGGFNVGATWDSREVNPFTEYPAVLNYVQLFPAENDKLDYQVVMNKEWFKAASERGMQIIYHLPFFISFFRDHDFVWDNAKSYMKKLVTLTIENRHPFIAVMHISNPFRKDKCTYIPEAEAMSRLMESISIYDKALPDGTLILLENTAGKKTAPYDFSSISFLDGVVKQSGSKKFGLCFDNNHAWAQGTSLDAAQFAFPRVNLFHMNSIVKGVRKGNHQDYHSFNPLSDTHADAAPYVTTPLKYALKSGTPFIFENYFKEDVESSYITACKVAKALGVLK